MGPIRALRDATERTIRSPCTTIVWHTPTLHPTAHADAPHTARLDRPGFDTSAVKWNFEHWLHVLSRPTFGQLHGGSPIETTRIATTSGSTAADVLDHTTVISWGQGRSTGQLLLEPFRVAPTEFGRPWIADATLHGSRMRRLRVSVAIFDHGAGRCGIQIRPDYRRPWSSRRLRRCLRSTHSASQRLRELVLAVDFMPPSHAPGVPRSRP